MRSPPLSSRTCEEELDVMEVSIADRYLQFVDDPLLQGGNEIVARFGYAGGLAAKCGTGMARG